MPEIFTGVITRPGLYPGIPENAYHADPVPGGSLSHSGARLLLPPGCPAIYDYQRRTGHQPTRAMDLGTTVHGLVLGTGPDIAVIDAPDWRTKAAKAGRDQAVAGGQVPMLAKDYAEAQAIAAAVKSHDTAGALFAEGDPEVSMFWACGETGVWCRARMDWHGQFYGQPQVVDFKTTKDASPSSFARSLYEYAYYLQDPWYRDGLAAILGCHWTDIDFVFVAVPTVPPYLPMIYRLTDADAERGRLMGITAREIYRDCMKTGVWPSWSDQIEDLPVPAYARTRIDKELSDSGLRISTSELPF